MWSGKCASCFLCGVRFNFLTGESHGAVLDNMFMGGECVLNHTVGTGNRVYFRVPANFKSYDLKVKYSYKYSIVL